MHRPGLERARVGLVTPLANRLLYRKRVARRRLHARIEWCSNGPLQISRSGFSVPMDIPRDRDLGVLDQFHPAVSSWFRGHFDEPTPAQRLGWPVIASGRHALIVAPTGSGKTLAAFLGCTRPSLADSPAGEGGANPLRFSPEGTESGRLAQSAVSPGWHTGRSRSRSVLRCRP